MDDSTVLAILLFIAVIGLIAPNIGTAVRRMRRSRPGETDNGGGKEGGDPETDE